MATVTGPQALSDAYAYNLVEFGKTVDQALIKWGDDVYGAIIISVKLLISTVLCIWVLWQGYKFLFDVQKPSLQKFIWDFLKALLVLSVALTLNNYKALIVNGIANLDQWLVDITGISTDSNVWVTVNNLWDKGWQAGQDFVNACFDGVSAWSPSTYLTGALGIFGFLGLLIFSGSILFGATLTLLISKFNIILLVAAGPLFLACAFADETRYVAVGWFKSLLSALLTIFFLILTMSLVSGLLTEQWTLLINAANSSAQSLAVPGGSGDTIGKMMVCFKIIFFIGIASFAICMVMCSLNKIAQGLVGGQSLGAGGWGAVTPFVGGTFMAARLLGGPLKQLGKAIAGMAGKTAGTVVRAGGIATMGAAGMAGAAAAAGAKAVGQTVKAGLQGVQRASQSVSDSGASGSSSGGGSDGYSGAGGGDSGAGDSGSGSLSDSSGSSDSSLGTGIGTAGAPSAAGAGAGSSGSSSSSPGSPSSSSPSSGSQSSSGGSGVSPSGTSTPGGSSSGSSRPSSGGSMGSTFASNFKSNFSNMTSNKPFGVLNQGVGAATTVSMTQAFRMGALNASTSRGIVGQTAGFVIGLMEKGVAEARYAGVIRAAKATGKAPTMEKPDSVGAFLRDPVAHANDDLKPFMSKENYKMV